MRWESAHAAEVAKMDAVARIIANRFMSVFFLHSSGHKDTKPNCSSSPSSMPERSRMATRWLCQSVYNDYDPGWTFPPLHYFITFSAKKPRAGGGDGAGPPRFNLWRLSAHGVRHQCAIALRLRQSTNMWRFAVVTVSNRFSVPQDFVTVSLPEVLRRGDVRRVARRVRRKE